MSASQSGHKRYWEANFFLSRGHMFRVNRLIPFAVPFGMVLLLATMPRALAMQNNQSPEILQKNRLMSKYIADITNQVMRRWHYSPGLVGTCVVEVTQKPGGIVTRVTVLLSCPYDDVNKHAVINAVMNASPLPYQGFESVFRDNLGIVFTPPSATDCHAGPAFKACEQAKVNELFKELDEAQARERTAALRARYTEAIKEAVRRQFVRPDSMSQTPCLVKVVQRPGGWVESVSVDHSCPYDLASRRGVEGAVLRAQPFPYKGFEAVFSPTFEFQFDPDFQGMSK
jgi:hypothetical protein